MGFVTHVSVLVVLIVFSNDTSTVHPFSVGVYPTWECADHIEPMRDRASKMDWGTRKAVFMDVACVNLSDDSMKKLDSLLGRK